MLHGRQVGINGNLPEGKPSGHLPLVRLLNDPFGSVTAQRGFLPATDPLRRCDGRVEAGGGALLIVQQLSCSSAGLVAVLV
jgi:hypothetical protein